MAVVGPLSFFTNREVPVDQESKDKEGHGQKKNEYPMGSKGGPVQSPNDWGGCHNCQGTNLAGVGTWWKGGNEIRRCLWEESLEGNQVGDEKQEDNGIKHH